MNPEWEEGRAGACTWGPGLPPSPAPLQEAPGRHCEQQPSEWGQGDTGVSTHLDGELLFTGVVVARGSLRTPQPCPGQSLLQNLSVGVNQLPGVLGREERPHVHQWVSGSAKPGESTQQSSAQSRKEMKYLSVLQRMDLDNMQLTQITMYDIILFIGNIQK